MSSFLPDAPQMMESKKESAQVTNQLVFLSTDLPAHPEQQEEIPFSLAPLTDTQFIFAGFLIFLFVR